MRIEWATERRAVAELKDYPNNPRKFTENGLKQLTDSVRSLGYIDPIAINLDGTIIGGHARKDVLLKLGLTEIDVRVPDRLLTEDEVAEAIIRLNKNTAGEWDFQKLEDSFEKADLLHWGFDKAEFNAFGSPDPKADEVPAIGSAAVTRLGDTWIMGNHRLRCGDSTNAQDVAALLAGAAPHLMVTDPPYGVEYDANWRNEVDRANGKPYGAFAVGKVSNDDRCDWSEAWALYQGDVAYVWHAGLRAKQVTESLEKSGFELRAQIIWAKSNMVIGRGHYHIKHEPCLYAVRKGSTGHWQGDRKQTTLWEIDKPQKSETGHSTQKPVECMMRPILNNSAEGAAVYEPFSGSGTTLIAAEITGRRCFAMEIDPLYCDVAVKRWQEYAGAEAVLERTGETFAARAA